jgi:antitoxin VapB
MTQTAKLFMDGRSQSVLLPPEFHFEGDEVFIRRDAATGDVVLSHKTPPRERSWDLLIALLKDGDIPAGFLSPEERDQRCEQNRDMFADWSE